LVEGASPGAVFLLDSRIPLVGAGQGIQGKDWLSTLMSESAAPPGDGFWPFNSRGGSRR
jgi:hypothetical protein